MSKFIKIEIEEVKEFSFYGCDFKIFLDEHGEEMNSKKLSNFLKKLMMNHWNICFFIGGLMGIDEKER